MVDNKCLVLHTYKSGLENDVLSIYPSIYFSLLEFKPKRYNILKYVFLHRKRINSYTVVTCGGFWQLFACLMFNINSPAIFCPGVASKYYIILSLINLKRFKIFTCDISFKTRFNVKFYQNYWPVRSILNYRVKTNDIALVGSNDQNKRFDQIAYKLQQLELTVVHAGSNGENLKKYNVNCLNNIPYNKLVKLYKSSRLTVCYSLYESSPRVLLEALENGCCIATLGVGNFRYINMTGIFACEGELLKWIYSVCQLDRFKYNKLLLSQITSINHFIHENPSD